MSTSRASAYSPLDPPLSTQVDLVLYEEKPIVPTWWKVAFVFSLCITAYLITLTCLTLHGPLKCNITALSWSLVILIACQIIFASRMIYSQATIPPTVPASSPIIIVTTTTSNPAMASNPLIRPTREDWETILKTQPSPGTRYYNLVQPGTEIAQKTAYHVYQIPSVGNYDIGYGEENVLAAFRVKHVDCFPPAIAQWFDQSDRAKLDCFLMFFNVSQLPQKTGYRECHLGLHAIAFPDFQSGKNQHPKATMEAGFYAAHNILNISPSESVPLQTYLYNLSIHDGVGTQEISYSPNTVAFYIPPKTPLATVYICAKLSKEQSTGRSVALHAILINQEDHPQSQTLLKALRVGSQEEPTPEQILSNLIENQFPYWQQIQRTLSYPS